MSHDLSVYLPDRPDAARLGAAARAAGVELGDGVLRHAGEYGADLGEPEPVEPGDIPQQVEPDDVDGPLADRLAACRWSVGVVVQGSGAADVERATVFARALAADDGVVEDPGDGLWTAGVTHRPQPRTEQTVDVVELRWYARRADAPADLPQRWLDACRAHLPAALPVRFGTSEPLRARFDAGGDAGFAAAYAAAVDDGDLLFYRGARPCFDGSLSGSRRGRVVAHGLTLDRAVNPAALLGLFTALAAATAAFYGGASVQRGLTWTGRSLYGPGPDQDLYLAPGGDWIGLPARPVAWSWFGPAYRRLVPRDLPTEPVGDGLLHRWSDGLLDRDALPERWLPAELTATTWDDRATRVPGSESRWWDVLRNRG